MYFRFLIVFIYLSQAKGQYAPKIKEYLTNSEAIIEGHMFRFLCIIDHDYPYPVYFRWVKNNIPINQQQDSIMIEDADKFSILTINKTKLFHTGNYTCGVENEFGQDIKTISLFVYKPLKWINQPLNITVFKGANVTLKCDVDGFPQPKIQWKKFTKSGDKILPEKIINFVNLTKVDDTGKYQCSASHSIHVRNEELKKVVWVKFFVPAKFDEKFQVVQVKKGESARLKCNATGDQPLTITWTKDNNKMDKLGGNNYEIFETITDTGMNSELLLRTTQRSDGNIYKCEAENEHGKDEKNIKLVIVEVPGPPSNVHVKEVWSRSASVVWTAPYSGNSPISKYIVQFWRHQNAPHRLNEFIVSNSQTSALIKDLSPGVSYELTVVAENDVGRGETAETIRFITGEEEPTAPPNDITVEVKGQTTVRITWKPPPIEHWNGVIKGYYVGYRRTRDSSHPYTLKMVEARPAQNHKHAEIETYEYFLSDNLMKGTEYSIVVKAFNSAGSGPHSHEVLVVTRDGDFPPSQQLAAFDSTENSISIRWHQKDLRDIKATVPLSFTIHYKRQDEPKWREIPVHVSPPQPSENPNHHPAHSYVLQNLEPGTNYKIYVTANNKFGLSDPSNIVITKTLGDTPLLRSGVGSDFFGPIYDNPYYLQPAFTIPILTAFVVVVIVFIIAFVCVKKIRSRAAANNLMLDSATISKHFAGYSGTAPRYTDFEKVSGKPLILTEQGNIYPTPYATMPMGERNDGKPWERSLPVPSSIKKDHHIYDHPQ